MPIEQAGNGQAERSRRTRERVISSTVGLIRQEGFPSASPQRITEHTGLSWGAVQHHFGSKHKLLKSIVLMSRDQFHQAVSADDYDGLDLGERIARFVDSSWRHYQSDVFLASVEITFWHRNNGGLSGEDIASDGGRTTQLTRTLVGRIFAGTPARIDKLVEATEYMHCVMTGLAFQMILTGNGAAFDRHLDHCRDMMMNIALEDSTFAFPAMDAPSRPV